MNVDPGSDLDHPSPVSGRPGHWFEPLADHMGSAYLRYSFTKGTVQEIDTIISMTSLAPGARVLDVGCGPGRHSLELARRDFDVVGLDVARRFVELAREAAAAEGLDRCRFVRGDVGWLADLDVGRFDLVLSLCQGAFGLSGGPESAASSPMGTPVELDEPILSAMAGALNPGGRLVVSAFSSYFHLAHTRPDQPNGAPSDDLPGETFDAATGVNHEWTTVRDSNGIGRNAQLWTTCYTPRELRLLARLVGLRPGPVYGVTPGDYGPYRPTVDHPELLLLAATAEE